MSMFCPQCGKAMTDTRCTHCGTALPLRSQLMRQRASGLDWTLRAVQILLGLCAVAVTVMAAMTLLGG